VIGRYQLPEMAEIFDDHTRVSLWIEIEVLAVEAWARIGVVPPEVAALVRERMPKADDRFLAEVAEREKVTRHDVAAFVDVLQERVGFPEAAWIHFGLTSSDVVDTALGAVLSRAAKLLTNASSEFVASLKRRALEHAKTPMAGRTHGMYAEPTTFGAKLALLCLQADRDRQRLERAKEVISVGKLSGAVGTYSNIDPRVEAMVCQSLGLQAVPASQVLARDRHAELLWACACSAATVETLGTEIRLLQSSEVGEVEEPFARGQKGSSAMPHKHNPIVSEQLCGMARLVRGLLSAGLENVALWHERDISHSSVERMALPDACQLAYWMLKRATWLVEGLVVHPERMLENLQASQGMVFSQSLLLALVSEGIPRDDAYRLVQRLSTQAIEQSASLAEIVSRQKEEIAKLLPRVGQAPDALMSKIEESFSLEHALANVPIVLSHLEKIDTASPSVPQANGPEQQVK
jgi:adenylosuccinate lyase